MADDGNRQERVFVTDLIQKCIQENAEFKERIAELEQRVVELEGDLEVAYIMAARGFRSEQCTDCEERYWVHHWKDATEDPLCEKCESTYIVY